MLTGNFNCIISPNIFRTASAYNRIKLKLTNGEEYTLSPLQTALHSITHGLFLKIGSGNQEPQFQDYQIEQPITDLTIIANGTDVSSDQRDIPYDEFDKMHYVTATSVVRNDTSSPIVVSEIAIYSRFKPTASDAEREIMLSRNVISPITIESGEQKAFSVTIGDE